MACVSGFRRGSRQVGTGSATPFPTSSEKLGSTGSDSPMKTLCAAPLALFHTMSDMMTVILHIDVRPNTDTLSLAKIALTSLTHLISVHYRLAGVTLVVRIVWHLGCLNSGCEGLRVLGTWIKPGWGLGITEIGRTGISSPHKKRRRGFQANPQQPI